MYHTPEATIEYAKEIALVQAEAFKQIIHLQLSTLDETRDDIEGRINDPFTKMFILLTKDTQEFISFMELKKKEKKTNEQVQ
jgi:hypothetical protein